MKSKLVKIKKNSSDRSFVVALSYEKGRGYYVYVSEEGDYDFGEDKQKSIDFYDGIDPEEYWKILN